MHIGERIKALRKAKKMTQAKLVSAVRRRGGDLSQPQLSAIEKGDVDRPGALIELADEFAVFPNWLLTGEGAKDRSDAPIDRKVADTPAAAATTPLTDVPPHPPALIAPVTPVVFSTGRPDIPVWSAVSAGDEQGTMLMTDQPIDWISRSERMMGVANPFAFYIVGDSMEHRFMAGDQAVVNPSMPMRSGADCVFICRGDDEQLYGLVKRLLRVTPDSWRVRQLNPQRDFELSRKKWTRAYPIAETRHRS